MYKEKDIVHETRDYWVLKDRKNNAYTVMCVGLTHSTGDSGYPQNDNGLSIAVARCNYLQRRKDEKTI